MSFAKILPVTLAIVVGSAALAQEKEKHLLRLNLKTGTVRHTVMTQHMDMAMNMGAQDIATTMDMKIFSTTKVGAVEGNKAELVQEITRVKAVMENPMMNVDFDSDDEDSDPGMLEGVADLVGSKSSLKIDDRGAMSDFKMSEEMSDAAESAGVNLEQMLKQSVIQMPEEPKAIGDTWTTKQKMPMGQMGDTETTVHFKLIAVDGKSITLEQKLEFDTDEMDVPGMEIEKIEAKGTTKVDLNTGTPLSMNMNIDMKMGGQMSMTMKIKQTIAAAPAPKKKVEEEKKDGGN